MNIAILGSGPSGLFAAHAAIGLGCNVRIFSKQQRSRIQGTQFLRREIPGLTGDPFLLEYKLVGDPALYSEKVGGDTKDLVDASGDLLFTTVKAWDIHAAYSAAWSEYGRIVEPREIENDVPEDILRWADLVISSIPAWELCQTDEHLFYHKTIWTLPFVKAFGPFADPKADDLVVCSGYKMDWWFRQSKIHGVESTEFHDEDHLPNGTTEVMIPNNTNCDCHPEIMRVGRAGTYDMKVFADQAFWDVQEFLLSPDPKGSFR